MFWLKYGTRLLRISAARASLALQRVPAFCESWPSGSPHLPYSPRWLVLTRRIVKRRQSQPCVASGGSWQLQPQVPGTKAASLFRHTSDHRRTRSRGHVSLSNRCFPVPPSTTRTNTCHQLHSHRPLKTLYLPTLGRDHHLHHDARGQPSCCYSTRVGRRTVLSHSWWASVWKSQTSGAARCCHDRCRNRGRLCPPPPTIQNSRKGRRCVYLDVQCQLVLSPSLFTPESRQLVCPM